MGLFDAARGAIKGSKAYNTHLSADKLAGEGEVSQAKEKYKEAMRLYDEAAGLGETRMNVLLSRAILLMREGEFEKARTAMLALGERKDLKDEERFRLRCQYSICLWRTGQLDEAIATINRAAGQFMTGTGYGMLGMYLVDRARLTGDFEEALAFNQKALDYDDEDPVTLDNMGQLYEAMAEAEGEGEAAEAHRAAAVSCYEKAHQIRPRQITTLYCLARMRHRAGEDKAALRLL
ncbi:MAG: hypothetical protein IJH38_05635, partial [Clostridia bacterium]|nr:hypothetical protein [Clostridia bacterium]